ncbi:MAG: twin-arginine translocase TatA/TatE family subunit [Pseudomonadota bacterium]
MLDFGWAELLLIIIIAVFVIGPKDIPAVMQSLGRIMRRLQYIRFSVSKQFDEFMNAADIEELRNGVNFEQKITPDQVVDEQEQDEQEVSKTKVVQKEEGASS